MGESESEIPSALALEQSNNEEDCTPQAISAQCGEVEGDAAAKSELGTRNEVDEMDQKEDVERLSEATSVIPDVSMLPRNGEHMQWWPIPSTRSAQKEARDSLETDIVGSDENNNPILPYVIDRPPSTVCMTFKANCSQDLIVALSSSPRVQNPFLEFRIGDRGNTSTVLRLKQHDEPIASVSCIPCSGGHFISYWVVHWPGHVSLGVGEEPGYGTLLVHDICLDLDLKRLEQCTPSYFSFSCLQYPAEITNIKIRVLIGAAALGIEPPNEAFYVAPGCLDGFGGADKKLVENGLTRFKKEAYRQKERAERFGHVYSPPALESFLPYTLVKRLSTHRGTPQSGIDTLSRIERNKVLDRAKRFGLSVPGENSPSIDDVAMELDGGQEVQKERRLSRGKRFGIGDISRMARLDEVGLKANDIFVDDPDRWDPREEATKIPEKIHVFVLDKGAAKMMRWNDLRAYFLRFGPREVEWLTDWSFNVVLQDKQDAEAALQELSYVLPSPPPPEFRPIVLEKEGKRLRGDVVDGDTATAYLQKPHETTTPDDPEVVVVKRHEDQYSTDDVVEDDKAVELKGEVERSGQVHEKEEPTELSSRKRDVGGMGWRLGRLLTKMHKDRHGPKGAWVRLLMRIATEDDMLEYQPVHPIQFIGPIPTRGNLPSATSWRGRDPNDRKSKRESFEREDNRKRRTWKEEENVEDEMPSKKKKTKAIDD